MEKTGIKIWGRYCWMALLLQILTGQAGRGQRLQTFKGYCGLYYSSLDHIRKQRGAELDFYQFRPGQSVASIGAQCCHWEAAIAAVSDSLHFYLQDIDSSHLNPRQAGFAWHYYDSLRGRPIPGSYSLVLGREDGTGLPPASCDKILVINSFHEFSNPAAMLDDLRDKLKKGGILYIDESVPGKPGQLHGICRKPMLAPGELYRLLALHGFEPDGHLDIGFRKGRTYRRIYAFRVKPGP